MKLELDYDCKTITVKDQTNLKDFIKEVKKLGLDLKEWNVISDLQCHWYTYPIYTEPNPFYYTDLTVTSSETDIVTGSPIQSGGGTTFLCN